MKALFSRALAMVGVLGLISNAGAADDELVPVSSASEPRFTPPAPLTPPAPRKPRAWQRGGHLQTLALRAWHKRIGAA